MQHNYPHLVLRIFTYWQCGTPHDLCLTPWLAACISTVAQTLVAAKPLSADQVTLGTHLLYRLGTALS